MTDEKIIDEIAGFQAVKNRIKSEKRVGDVKLACKRAGTDADTHFRTAMAKDSYDALSPTEERVLIAMIEVLNERVKYKKMLTSIK